jgi:hypothetical protein
MDTFFEYLAIRKKDENDLSDITWAMCLASDYFKIKFLNFFFPNDKFDNSAIIKREYTGKNNSRVDFYIENSCKEKYIIECKINDRNYHFEQYAEDFEISNDKMGFISNYKIYKKGFITKTWDELWDILFKSLSDLQPDTKEFALIKGYLAFLKKVCRLNTINMNDKLSYKEMFSVYNFMVLLKKTINKINTEKYYLKSDDLPYSRKSQKELPLGSDGYYFDIIFLTEITTFPDIKEKPVKGCVGISYNNPLDKKFPVITFYFEEGEIEKNVYDLLSSNIKKIDYKSEFFNNPYYEDYDKSYCFDLPEKKLEEYENQPLEKQGELIEKFITSVIEVSFNLKS